MNKNQTSIFVKHDLILEDGHFTRSIVLPFIPKTVTVSNLCYRNPDADPAESGVSVLRTNIVSTLDNVIGIIRDEYTQNNMTFPCRPDIRGVVDFWYDTPDEFDGILTFALTFKD